MEDEKIFLFPMYKVSCSFLSMSSYNPGREKSLKQAGLVFGRSLQEVPAIVYTGK
jgi:hypothetical protein